MTQAVETLPSRSTVGELSAIFRQSRVKHRGYPLLDEAGRLCGIVTATDVLGAHPQDQDLRLIDLIPKRSLITADPNESCKDLAERMSLEGVGRLLITQASEPEKLLGIVTRSDLLKARHRHYTEESKRETLMRRTGR